jgi:hypothetical protein
MKDTTVSERNFSMRLKSSYEGDTNTVASLAVEHKVGDQWQPLDLDVASPGFDIFVYAIFACQHRFFRVTCAERKLILNSAAGTIVIGADNSWNMEILKIHFSGQLGSGQVSPGDIDYIVSRMKQCPVSLNIREAPDTESTVILN